MKKKLVLTLLCALTLGTVSGSLVSCNSTPVTPEPAPDPIVNKVTIDNKAALQEEWNVGKDNRRVNLATTVVGYNVADEVANGKIVLTTSDSNVVSVLGQYLVAIAPGTATVSVSVTATNTDGKSLTEITDTVDVTVSSAVLEKNVIVSTVAEIAASTDSVGSAAANQKYVITGKLAKWAKGTDGGDYGNFSLSDLEDPTKELIVYGATAKAEALTFNAGLYKFSNPKDWKTNAATKDLVVGDFVSMVVTRCDYKGTIEVNGIITKQLKPSEILADTATYTRDGAVERNIVTGYVQELKSGTGTEYGNIWISDSASSTEHLTVYGSSLTSKGVWSVVEATGLLKYTNPKDFLSNTTTAALKVGDKVVLDCVVFAYKTTIELSGTILSINA